MKAKLLIALVAILFVAEWIMLKQSTPGPSAARDEPIAPREPTLLGRSTFFPSRGSPETNTVNRLSQMLESGEMPKLTAAQVEPYLADNKRNAESLLAAFETTWDQAYLREAKEKFPRDPHVDYFAATHTESPEERRHWLDLLKQTAPDNCLGDYLSANDYFKSGQTNLALRELTAATAKINLNDYSKDNIQNAEEAYRAAGYSEVEARAMAMSSAAMPQLAQYKQLANSVTELANACRQAGDPDSAQSALQMGLTLGQRLDDSSGSGSLTIIQDLVGQAVERMMLGKLDPARPYGSNGQTVKDQLDTLQQRRDAIRTLVRQSEGLLQSLPNEAVATYYDRRKTYGEEQAMRWMVAKYGQAQ